MKFKLQEKMNKNQLTAVRQLKAKYAPFFNVKVRNLENGDVRVVLESKEFKKDIASGKIKHIIEELEKMVCQDYFIRYEYPLETTDLNYPGYHLFRKVVLLRRRPQRELQDEPKFNEKTGYIEMNGHEYLDDLDELE